MALIKCKECKKELSSTAKMCPNCGEITEYGRNSKRKLIGISLAIIVVVVAVIICDQMAIFKSCDYKDEKVGNICIKKHYSDALIKEECLNGYYLKDGKCYSSTYTLISRLPIKKSYCNEGYLEEGIIDKCVVETTYDAKYEFLNNF